MEQNNVLKDSKEFQVKRMANGKDNSHLVVVIEPALEDINIGTVIIVPYVDGFKDPKKVMLQVDDKGNPKRANNEFAIVTQYIYE